MTNETDEFWRRVAVQQEDAIRWAERREMRLWFARNALPLIALLVALIALLK